MRQGSWWYRLSGQNLSIEVESDCEIIFWRSKHLSYREGVKLLSLVRIYVIRTTVSRSHLCEHTLRWALSYKPKMIERDEAWKTRRTREYKKPRNTSSKGSMPDNTNIDPMRHLQRSQRLCHSPFLFEEFPLKYFQI